LALALRDPGGDDSGASLLDVFPELGQVPLLRLNLWNENKFYKRFLNSENDSMNVRMVFFGVLLPVQESMMMLCKIDTKVVTIYIVVNKAQ
jgi:hypothetical protein